MFRIDYIVMILYLVGLLAVGFIFATRIRNSRDMFAVEGRVPPARLRPRLRTKTSIAPQSNRYISKNQIDTPCGAVSKLRERFREFV